MTYDHAVKVNGKWFKAGEDINLSPALTTEKVAVDVGEKKVEPVEKPATPKRSYTKRK